MHISGLTWYFILSLELREIHSRSNVHVWACVSMSYSLLTAILNIKACQHGWKTNCKMGSSVQGNADDVSGKLELFPAMLSSLKFVMNLPQLRWYFYLDLINYNFGLLYVPCHYRQPTCFYWFWNGMTVWLWLLKVWIIQFLTETVAPLWLIDVWCMYVY